MDCETKALLGRSALLGVILLERLQALAFASLRQFLIYISFARRPHLYEKGGSRKNQVPINAESS